MFFICELKEEKQDVLNFMLSSEKWNYNFNNPFFSGNKFYAVDSSTLLSCCSGSLETMPFFEQKRKKRKAVRRTDLRWPDGVMPYTFADGHFSKYTSVSNASIILVF